MSDYPREITLKDNTKVTIDRTHTIEIKQGEDTVLIDGDGFMQIFLGMREESPRFASHEVGDRVEFRLF